MHCCLLSKIISFSSLNISSGSHSEVITFFSSELLEEDVPVPPWAPGRDAGSEVAVGRGSSQGSTLLWSSLFPTKPRDTPSPGLGLEDFARQVLA